MNKPARCKNGYGQPALQGFEWRLFRRVWELGDLSKSESLKGNGMKVPIQKKVRLEAFPNGLPIPVRPELI